jgi:NAD+ kinase
MEIDYNGQSSKAGLYKANTLIISGPCGSTAYSMNAGGCIVDPSVRCMQILMVAPTTIVRPLIVGKNSNIKIQFKHDSKIFIDGAHYKDVSENDSISISLVQEEVKVLLPLDWNFYSVLSKKLHWNNGKEV